MTEETVYYIVDYDIPANPSRRRRGFYRALKKLKEGMDLYGRMSTMSVLITVDREFAESVYLLAMQYGRANMYEARKLG